MHTILIVDDEPVQRRLLEAALTKAGHLVIKAENGSEALSHLNGPHAGKIKAVILDLIMPEVDGMSVMQSMKDTGIDIPVIVQTAQGGIETVVGAMRLGAFDFVVKPVSPDRLQTSIEKVLRLEGSKKSSHKADGPNKETFTFKDIVSSDPSMDRVLRIGKKASTSQIPVLIEGESGVGKELIAKAIQSNSDRSEKPFITVNCGALPENLVESLLFGHEKGAFTGASEKHIGKFVEANGGTLFLDEVGELPIDLQVKLLRAIQEGVIDPIGAKKPVEVDIRLISATNRDLIAEVKEGRFREDLYYRLNVLPMRIPPLRDRPSDIPALVFHFVKKFCREEKRNDISAVNPQLMQALVAHDWPGNIRELENAVFRAIVLCEGDELTLDDFPQIATQMPEFDLQETVATIQAIPTSQTPSITTPLQSSTFDDEMVGLPSEQSVVSDNNQISATGTYGMVNMISQKGAIRPIVEVEKEMIEFAIEIYNGKMSEVARRLGIGRSTLYRKLNDYGLEEDINGGKKSA